LDRQDYFLSESEFDLRFAPLLRFRISEFDRSEASLLRFRIVWYYLIYFVFYSVNSKILLILIQTRFNGLRDRQNESQSYQIILPIY